MNGWQGIFRLENTLFYAQGCVWELAALLHAPCVASRGKRFLYLVVQPFIYKELGWHHDLHRPRHMPGRVHFLILRRRKDNETAIDL